MKTLKLIGTLFFLSIMSIMMSNCTPQIVGVLSQSQPSSSSSPSTATSTPTPVPISFSPSSGAAGVVLTLSGPDFTTATSVTVGGMNAIIINQSTNSMMVEVMPGTSSGAIVVTLASGSQTATGSFAMNATGLPTTQQGSKLVGGGASGNPIQGRGVAISADGNTVAVGGPGDVTSEYTGAVWIFTKSGSTWTQQGSALIGSDYAYVGDGLDTGYSVALSADGNTMLTGAYYDNSDVGAAFVFTRSGTTWTQQGPKLVGSDHMGDSAQGWSVSLSADGNTALVGGYYDNSEVGASWVYQRSGSTWTQMGSKLVGSDASESPQIGTSVALSSDGKTAVMTGPNDNGGWGAAWVYILNGSSWIQQGSKLFGTGSDGGFGSAIAVSADGNAMIVGSDNDNYQTGAIWMFSRSGTTWSATSGKITESGAPGGTAGFGSSVAISADGTVAIAGGWMAMNSGESYEEGAGWVFQYSAGSWSQQTMIQPSGYSGNAQFGVAAAMTPDATSSIYGAYENSSGEGAAWIFTQ